jgi:hypothetical protein
VPTLTPARAKLGTNQDHGGQGELPDAAVTRTILRRERARWDREEERRKNNVGLTSADTDAAAGAAGAGGESSDSNLGMSSASNDAASAPGDEGDRRDRNANGNGKPREFVPGTSPAFHQKHTAESMRQGYLPMDTTLAVPLNPFQELNPHQHRDMIKVGLYKLNYVDPYA